MRQRKTVFIGILLIGGFLFFFLLSQHYAKSFTELYPVTSLRYTEPISLQTAAEYKKSIAENRESYDFWPTFWSETYSTAKTTRSETDTANILFDGDAGLVWPQEFLSGTFPGELDTDGCAVSDALAWALWGSTDVTGLSFELDGVVKTVRGVFRQEEAICFTAGTAKDQKGWYNVELAGTYQEDAYTQVESFVQNLGLGTPDTIVDHQFLSGAAGILFWIPCLYAFVIALLFSVRYIKKMSPLFRGGSILLLLFCFALLLPIFLDTLPSWLLPTKWSDFNFWEALLDRIQGYLQSWVSMVPTMKDIQAKLILIKLLASVFLFLFLLAHNQLKLSRFTPQSTHTPSTASHTEETKTVVS